MAQLSQEAEEKEHRGQARIVLWDGIKDNPPVQFKVSPIAMVPHKSWKWRAILDLAFRLRLREGGHVPSVNENTVKTGPQESIDQLGHALLRIIHAFAEAEPEDMVSMTKLDLKDGFWRLDCEDGEEWNFAYVLPQPEGEPVKLVVPISLQMGWIESPSFFCAASEMARDVAEGHINERVGALTAHKFLELTNGSPEYKALAQSHEHNDIRYMLEVFVDNFVSLIIPTSRDQLDHIANSVMTGMHGIFPPEEDRATNPVTVKKIERWSLRRDLLGFEFDGQVKTMALSEEKRESIAGTVGKWLRCADWAHKGIPSEEFYFTMEKVRHAITAVPVGKGLLSPCNDILALEPSRVFLHRNKKLLSAVEDCRTFLQDSFKQPTPCRELVAVWPSFVGVKDTSLHGVWGIVFGEDRACLPTVFGLPWPDDVKANVNPRNSKGRLTNSDLECAGLVLLWLVMEEVLPLEQAAVSHVALFSNNQPTVSWVGHFEARGSLVVDQLL